jgi:hypothetical protein
MDERAYYGQCSEAAQLFDLLSFISICFDYKIKKGLSGLKIFQVSENEAEFLYFFVITTALFETTGFTSCVVLITCFNVFSSRNI